LVKNNSFWLLGWLLLGLAACTVPARAPAPVTAPAPAPGGQGEVDSQVRQPARRDSEGVQVFPLQNPAVTELLAEASGAESAGDLDQATVLLERALRIQPQNPEILQQMAEVQIQKSDYLQALTFAVRSYDLGPRVGEICSRNWRTISVAKGHLDDENGARQAEQNAATCMNTKLRSQ